jgi:hypothetical protein
MKYKRILTAAAILLNFCCLNAINAQTFKHDWLVGGVLDINTAKNNTGIEFSPNAGYFIIDNLAIGAKMIISYNQLGDLKVTSFGAGPFMRYYFTAAKIKPFFAAEFDYQNQKFSTGTGSSTENAFNYFLGGGAAFFINENVAIEAILGYGHTSVKNDEGSGGLNFRVGFQVYLGRHQVESVKSTIIK